jgi:hypothetical protein
MTPHPVRRERLSKDLLNFSLYIVRENLELSLDRKSHSGAVIQDFSKSSASRAELPTGNALHTGFDRPEEQA